jgi:transcriptional regulator with GAF, ATPase, and Fis domain
MLLLPSTCHRERPQRHKTKQESDMSSPFAASGQSNPELSSLYRIALIPQSQPLLQDYFHSVWTVLSDYFPMTYSALLLQEPQRDSVRVEATYGLGKETHPVRCSRKGTIGKVLESRKPMAIQNLVQEPLYEELAKGTKRIERLDPPLLCVPLVADDESLGVININPLHGTKVDFDEDFLFLSTLCAILSPVVRNHQNKGAEPLSKHPKQKATPHILEDFLKERLGEVLNKIDPYVESKARLGLLDDIIALVEKILITSAMEKVGHVQVAAAQLLGINRNTLRKKIKDLKIKY